MPSSRASCDRSRRCAPPSASLDAGQRQQLIGQVGQPVGALGRRLQAGVPVGRLRRAQAQLQPRLERCQRGAQLVGGIGDELRLALELPAQALGEVVQRLHQGAQFVLHLDHRQRPQVVRLALLDRAAQPLQRAQRRADGEPHQQQRAQAEHAQAQQGIAGQAARHGHPGLFGLGHAHFRHAVHVRFADRLEQAHHTNVLTAVAGTVEARQRRIVVGAQGIPGGRRQILVAGDPLALDVVDLIEDAPGAVVGERVEGQPGHVGTQVAVAHHDPGGDGSRRGQQGTVIGGVGGLAAVPVGTHAAGQHQYHQQQRQVPQQPPAQAVGITHRGFPANSPGRGR
jgi:hypothetical protein